MKPLAGSPQPRTRRPAPRLGGPELPPSKAPGDMQAFGQGDIIKLGQVWSFTEELLKTTPTERHHDSLSLLVVSCLGIRKNFPSKHCFAERLIHRMLDLPWTLSAEWESQELDAVSSSHILLSSAKPTLA